jgi:hypothetical protein
MAKLSIGRFHSKCLSCGNGADPYEEFHTTRLGYGVHDGKGCGEKFTEVVAEYAGTEETIKKMRPDLEYIGYF